MTELQSRPAAIDRAPADLTVLVPTYNESGNVAELVARLVTACAGIRTEILFVDDSTDDTPEVIRAVMAHSPVPVHLVHRLRGERVGGLSGAVAHGLAVAEGARVVVMDGDLQHPPELVPRLYAAGMAGGHDVVVASRYCGDGDAGGLSDTWRRAVSSVSTTMARAAFPRRVGRHCTDPMTGFFCVDRAAVDLARLQPRGFKILLEILARHDVAVSEVPFTFGERHAGESKAGWRQGLAFGGQLLRLRLSRIGAFAAVGLLGLAVNLLTMATLLALGTTYVLAALVAAEVSIVSNLALQERFVFADRRHAHPLRRRVWRCLVFNNLEAAARLPVLILLVEVLAVAALPAQALTIAAAFAARYAFVSKVVYA